jgi:adenylate cyclase
MFAASLRFLRRSQRTAYLGLAAALPALLFGWLYHYEYTDSAPWETQLTRAELAVGDFFRNHGRPTPLRPDLVFLGIDNASLSLDNLWPEDIAASRALQLISQAKGAWNWSREVDALVLERLMDAGARLVLFDLVMPTPNAGDGAFRAALDRYRDHVVIGSELGHAAVRDTGGETGAFSEPSPTLIAHPKHDPRVGYVNYQGDEDDVIRQLSFATTQQALQGAVRHATDQVYWSFLAQALRQLGRADLIPAQLRPRIFRYTDLTHGKGYAPRSLAEIFVDPIWKQNYQDGAFFKNKIVIIGPSAKTLHDVQITPYGEIPGPDLHLEALTAALNQDYLHQSSVGADLALIAAAGFLAWGLGVAVRQPVVRLGSMVGVSALFLLLLQWLYNRNGLLAAAVTPLIVFNTGGLGGLIGEYVVERAEKARVRGVLDRLVSKDIVRELLGDRESYAALVRGQRRCVTVLFSDVRGFTTLSEGAADPAAFIAQLNEYLGEMVDVVFKHRGTLDKFIGDAVMAVWGSMHTDGAQADARQAVAAALEMRERLAALNARWAAEGKLPLAIGIGVNYGEVIVGGLGSEKNKMEITVMGDAVNTASRLEGLTKEYGLDLLIGENVAERVSEVFRLRTVDLVRVKGKKKPTEVMTVLGPLADVPPEAQEEFLADYEDAILLYRRRQFCAAQARLEGCLKIDPGDRLSALYLDRCRELIEHEPAAEWDGVRLMLTK